MRTITKTAKVKVAFEEADYLVLKALSDRYQIPIGVLGRTAVLEYLRNHANDLGNP